MALDLCTLTVRLHPWWLAALKIACYLGWVPAVHWLARHPLVKVVR
jgi:hypothetical protein